MKQTLQSLLANGKTAQVLAALQKRTGLDSDTRHLIVQLAARFAENERQKHAGTLDNAPLSTERNKINAAILAVIEQLPELSTLEENDNLENKSQNSMKQKQSSSSDYVAGNKIGRQINMGDNSTYNEQQNSLHPQTSELQNKEQIESTSMLPETPSGFLGQLFKSIPKPINYLLAIGLLCLVAYVGFHYFMPQKEQAATLVLEKVYVSGIIHINNGIPKLNEITSMRLRDIDANPARIDGVGKFTFSDVKIPPNKRLLVDVTFGQTTVSTEELIVGEADKDTKTVRLPDLYATRPQAAKNGRPANNWKIQVNVNTGNGQLNATQN